MPTVFRTWPRLAQPLLKAGKARLIRFCEINSIRSPYVIEYCSVDWLWDCCAYYRDDCIHICVSKCATPAPIANCRNWNWPGNTTDREPYGVLCHELGHHCDLLASKAAGLKIGKYSGELSKVLMEQSGERPITSYCPNPSEWFAEMFRLFVTNPRLLALVRPKTYNLFLNHWRPILVSNKDWMFELGTNVPPRILAATENKIKQQGSRSALDG